MWFTCQAVLTTGTSCCRGRETCGGVVPTTCGMDPTYRAFRWLHFCRIEFLYMVFSPDLIFQSLSLHSCDLLAPPYIYTPPVLAIHSPYLRSPRTYISTTLTLLGPGSRVG